jgi:hypothetical protein
LAATFDWDKYPKKAVLFNSSHYGPPPGWVVYEFLQTHPHRRTDFPPPPPPSSKLMAKRRERFGRGEGEEEVPYVMDASREDEGEAVEDHRNWDDSRLKWRLKFPDGTSCPYPQCVRWPDGTASPVSFVWDMEKTFREDQELGAFLDTAGANMRLDVAWIPEGCVYRIHEYDGEETVIPRPPWKKCARELAGIAKGTLAPADACDMTRFLLEHPDGRINPPRISRSYLPTDSDSEWDSDSDDDAESDSDIASGSDSDSS